MPSIHRLRALLHSLLEGDLPALFDELRVQTPTLLNLLHVGPRNPTEQRELESGKPTIHGKTTTINADFSKLAVFLSQQLDCSENHVATILYDIMNENPNIDAVGSMESTVEQFHLRRRNLVDSVYFLLEATRRCKENPADAQKYDNLAQYVRKELIPGSKSGSRQESLAQNLLKQAEQLDSQIAKADAARKNAGSNTVPPSAGNPALGFDVLNARYDSLKYERRFLAISLCTLAQIGCLSPTGFKEIIEWLSNDNNHPLTFYYLAAIFVTLEPVDPGTPIADSPRRLAMDIPLVDFMSKKLQPSTKWKDPGLKAAVLLKWSLFLTQARHDDMTLENRPGFKAEELETQIWNAVQGDAFRYLATSVVHLQGKSGMTPAASILENSPADPQDAREVPSPDFRETVLFSFESLVRSLITHASSELRKIKQRQEDVVLAGARTERRGPSGRFTGVFHSAGAITDSGETQPTAPRHDLAMLYSFIGLLYLSLPEESALQFWGSSSQLQSRYQDIFEESSGRLPSFLQWAVWSTPTQDPVMLAALYDMLNGLANGQQCSELAYNFLARGGGEVLPGSMLSGSTGGAGSAGASATAGPSVSWTAIFGVLESWATAAANPRPHHHQHHQSLSHSLQNLAAPPPSSSPQFVLTPKDITLAKSFLRVLASVSRNSPIVRITIAEHAHFRAIPTLLSLVPLGVPLELKGALFDTLAAFCEPGAGSQGVEICKAVWTIMERLEVINVRMGGPGAGSAPGFGFGLGGAPAGMGGGVGGMGRGIEVELEQVEATHQLYPSTIPFLRLLAALIHTPKQLAIINLGSSFSSTESLNTIPDGLGSPYRPAGIAPFTAFVVDNVFSNIPRREYARPSDRWQMNDLCLEFIEKSLACFNLEILTSGVGNGYAQDAANKEILLPLILHPGHDIMKRLLTDSPLQRLILSYVADGLAGFEKGLADEEPFYRSTIVRVLRIIKRVLEIQDIFLDVFIPILSAASASASTSTPGFGASSFSTVGGSTSQGQQDFNPAAILGAPIHTRSYFTRFDQALSFGAQYIPSIAAYMAYFPSYPELILLSIQIMSSLSLSLTSNALTTLIERSSESERILNGFVNVLSSQSKVDVERAEEVVENRTGAGAPPTGPSLVSASASSGMSSAVSAGAVGAGGDWTPAECVILEQAIRAAALQLLIQDTESQRVYPNLAHFFLFGSSNTGGKTGTTIQDPRALGARTTAIHVLLSLINAGVPRLRDSATTNTNHKSRRGRSSNNHSSPDDLPLYIVLPSLAERCYRVIYQLCIHPRTAEFTSRYLRTREDFFARQVARIPSQAPPAASSTALEEGNPIEVVYGDGSRVITTVSGFTSFLRLRSFIFELVALELHILTNKGHHKAVKSLTDILFGTDLDRGEEEEEEDGVDEFGFPRMGSSKEAFHEVGQSPMRIIGFLQSLLFDWADSFIVAPVELKFLAQLNLQACVRPADASGGCNVVDRNAVWEFLDHARRSLIAQGTIATQAQNEQLDKEIQYVLESCAAENHRRMVGYARGRAFEAWRKLLDMGLTKCFARLPHERRENMLFDLLHVLPVALREVEGGVGDNGDAGGADADSSVSTAVLLSETVLSAITKLREDRRHQLILQSVAGDPDSGSLPAERLHGLLRNLLEGILSNNHVELVRGNLYAALINYIHLTRSSNQMKISVKPIELDPFGVSLSSSRISFDTSLNSSSLGRSRSLPAAGSSNLSAIESGNLTIFRPVIERFISTVARDAIDGTEVWKTVAFMLLDAVVQLSGLDAKGHVVLSGLSKHGILSNFVRSIKDSDGRLLAVLKPNPDDLNVLYVYESKMSLFIRMAQTRPGAERLLETQLIPILSQCEYIDARPEADQAFIDQDAFLPSAIQRYQQLFTPALQVVDAMLGTLGNRHAGVTKQALDFLMSHGSTIAILLKHDAEQVTLATLEEIYLIITLCSNVLPTVPKSELLSTNSAFGSIHVGILGLATRCLGRGQPYGSVVPQSESDVKLTEQLAYGFGNRTAFDVAVTRTERKLRKAIIAYVGACSEFTEPEITLVLSPVTITPRREERATYISSTVPTIGDALAALDDICNDFASTLKQISDIGAELAKKDQISIEGAQSILRDLDPLLVRNLEIDQKRILLSQELERIQKGAKNDGRNLLDSLEMILLLLWRHLEYYATPQHMQNPPTKTTIANAMRLLATSDPEVFKAEVGQRLGPTLSKLYSQVSEHELFHHDWQDNRGYIEIMLRRLRDSVGSSPDETMSGGDKCALFSRIM